MALATLQAVVDALTSTVDYLRVSIDAPGEDWLPCEALCTDAVTLHTVVATTKSAYGISAENEPAVSVTERAAAQRGDTVAMSLFVQGYVFRARDGGDRRMAARRRGRRGCAGRMVDGARARSAERGAPRR